MTRRILAAAGALATAALLFGTAVPATAAPEPEPPSDTTTLSEQVAAAAADGAEGADALADAVGLPASGPASLAVDDAGAVAVTVEFASGPSSAQRAAVAAIGRVDRVYTFGSALAATVDPERLPELDAIEGVLSVSPVQKPLVGGSAPGSLSAAAAIGGTGGCRSIPVDADGPLRTAEARELFGVDGTGVTIGIVSDSFAGDPTALTTPAHDVALGVLPGPGNPCGYETPVRVLADYTEPDASDEGRGMAQVVHGIAPGAELLFATGYIGGVRGMAQNIIDLAEAGADVIVDDLGYADSPYYQQGIVSWAIEYVKATFGVAYYSSSGNATVIGSDDGPSAGKPISAWSTDAYRPTACPEWVAPAADATAIDCLDFDPSGDTSPYDVIYLSGDAVPRPLMSWAEPMFSPAFTKFDVRLYDLGTETPERIGGTFRPTSTTPNLMVTYPEGLELDEGRYALVVVRDVSAGVPASNPAVWITFFGHGADAVLARRFDHSQGGDVVGRTTFGHPADGSATGVAASPWTDARTPEKYSSFGPGILRFDPADLATAIPSAAYPTPVLVPAPVISGVDGSQTSFFGRQVVEDGETVWRFFATSASAPSVAAVHALAQSYIGAPNADLITARLQGTAGDMSNPWAVFAPDDAVFGAGLADGAALLAAPPPAAVSAVSATATASSVTATWPASGPAVGYRAELLRGDEVVATAHPDAATTTFDDALPETAYRVRVTTTGPGGEPGGQAVSDEVTTPRPAQPGVAPAAPPTPTEGTRGSLTATPSTVEAGGTVTVTGLPPRAWTYGWLFSTPTPLNWAWTGAAGAASFTVPATTPAGTHRLAVTTADGTLIGWVELTVTGAAAPAPITSGTLPATGAEPPTGALWAGGLALALGIGMLLLARRRTASL